MKLIRAAFAAVAACAIAATTAFAQEPPKGLHVMAMEAGVWDAEVTFPSRDPSKPDQKAKGVQENELRSEGRWIINKFQIEGMPYQGTGVWGYDRSTGRYSGIWVDNNDQTIRADDGRWDEATQTMTWSANIIMPDGRQQRLLFTEEFKGDVRIFNMVGLTRKGEVPLVRMVFTKRKSS